MALPTPVDPTGSCTGNLPAQIAPRNNRSHRRREFPISRRDAPELCVDGHPLKTRGRRESRVRAAPAVSCAQMQKKRTRAYRFSGGNPAFPAQWFTAYSVLSSVTGLSCHRRPREVLLPADLTPASGRQDHTASPSASARVRLSQAFASTASHRAFVTIATRPSHRVRRAKLNH